MSFKIPRTITSGTMARSAMPESGRRFRARAKVDVENAPPSSALRSNAETESDNLLLQTFFNEEVLPFRPFEVIESFYMRPHDLIWCNTFNH